MYSLFNICRNICQQCVHFIHFASCFTNILPEINSMKAPRSLPLLGSTFSTNLCFDRPLDCNPGICRPLASTRQILDPRVSGVEPRTGRLDIQLMEPVINDLYHWLVTDRIPKDAERYVFTPVCPFTGGGEVGRGTPPGQGTPLPLPSPYQDMGTLPFPLPLPHWPRQGYPSPP